MDERLTLLAMIYIESARVDLNFNHTVKVFAADSTSRKTFRQLNRHIFSSVRKNVSLFCGFLLLNCFNKRQKYHWIDLNKV